MPRGPNDNAQIFADRLKAAIEDMRRLPQAGVRCLPLISGLGPDGTTSANIDNILHEIGTLLVGTKRIYIFGDSVVIEADYGAEKRLVTLANNRKPAPGATAWLGGLFKCKFERQQKVLEYLPNPTTAGLVLAHEPTLVRLPAIQMYAKRPVFDNEFRFLGPGWHQDSGILVHGPEVHAEPAKPHDPSSAATSARERLPPNLKRMLGEFCFQTDADLVNAVGVLLTGLLMPMFINHGHAVVQIDGNQSSVGKSILAESIAGILDGEIPSLLWYTANEEELQKSICAQLRENPGQTSLIFDNAKKVGGQRIESAVIELNSVAPILSFRVLGGSTQYKRPNDVLWFFTMNQSKLSQDLASRCIAIRLHYDGDPHARTFQGPHPTDTAVQFRTHILAELAGMVLLWNQMGRPMGSRPHRLKTWSNIIAGILEANGFPEFLDNLQDATNDFNAELDDLRALAEAAASRMRLCFKGGTATTKSSELEPLIARYGQNPALWVQLFKDANVLQDKLEATKSEGGKGKSISNFLSKYIDRQITVTQGDQEVMAILRRAQGSSNKTIYCFQIVAGDQTESPGAEDQVGCLGAGVAPDFSERRAVRALALTKPPIKATADSEVKPSNPSPPHSGGNEEDW